MEVTERNSHDESTDTDQHREPRILEETNANWYVLKPDGTTENIPKSPENRLLYEHNLYGLLREGDDILVIDHDDRPRVRLVAGENAVEYTLTVGNGGPLHLGAHMKGGLVNRLVEVYEGDRAVEPLISYYDDVRRDRVRSDVISELAAREPFASAVESSADGWLIHDHLLLTWERDLHHPDTTAYNRRGNTVAEGSSEIAYELRVRNPSNDSDQRQLTVDGTTYRLTDAEMEFVAKATWGLKYAPRLGGAADE
jgi:hypothetical protein